MTGILLLISPDWMEAQPTQIQFNSSNVIKGVSDKRLTNANQNLQDVVNFRNISSKDQKKEAQSQNNLKTLNGIKFKPSLAEVQKIDSIVNEHLDTAANEWRAYIKLRFTYNEYGNTAMLISYGWNTESNQWENNY